MQYELFSYSYPINESNKLDPDLDLNTQPKLASHFNNEYQYWTIQLYNIRIYFEPSTFVAWFEILLLEIRGAGSRPPLTLEILELGIFDYTQNI